VSVEVRLPSLLRSAAGGASSVQVEGTTIGDVLADLVQRFPALDGRFVTEGGEMHKFLNVYLNDDDVRFLDKLATKVADGDSVTVLPAVAGG